MSQLLVSIVIPHFDRAELLAETLDSLQRQEHSNWEAIIVDDGSRPEEWAATQSLAGGKVRVLQRSDGEKGPSRCRNLGAASARGDYLLFLDSDDLLAPWCLAGRLKVVAAQPNADLWVFPVLLFRERPGDMTTCWNRLEGDDDLERFLRSDPPWHTSSPLWRRVAFERIGGFNERMLYGDDAELHTRMLLRGLIYHKVTSSLPDLFVRRGKAPRMTSAVSGMLLNSRFTRLWEGSRLLVAEQCESKLMTIWEGQYFVESEELMFNVTGSESRIQTVLDLWAEQYQPSRCRHIMVRTYFHLGVLCRKRAYWVVRALRRWAMAMLPPAYFPSGGWFERWMLTDAEITELRKNLQQQRS